MLRASTPTRSFGEVSSLAPTLFIFTGVPEEGGFARFAALVGRFVLLKVSAVSIDKATCEFKWEVAGLVVC